MPSNPTLPEDVREKAAGALLDSRKVDHDELAWSEARLDVDAIAPLIIEWARKDQAALTEEERLAAAFAVEHLIDKHGFSSIVSRSGSRVALDGLLDRLTPETTGAPDDHQ